jgi:Fe-S cluster assembly protein SufD
MTTMLDAAPALSSHLHPAASWNVADHPIPTGREENWRFTPVDRISPLFLDALSGDNLMWETRLPDGVRIAPIGAADAIELAVGAPIDRVGAVAARNAGFAAHVDIPAGLDVDGPIVLTGTGIGDPHVNEHLVVTVGAGARATLVLRYRGSAELATKTDVRVGEGADFTLVTVADWDDTALHGGQASYLVGRDAHVRTVAVTLGGSVVRLVDTARFDGPGGTIEQFGLYFADAGQHLEHRLFVDHDAPHTTSLVDYRGALQGKGAHSVWIGDVLIRKHAEGTSTYEQNRNLVLTDGCIADSVPNLEIETGEIAGAGHSSTTGRFDDEQLFYLMSRGIPAAEAKRLVVEGFFVEIIRRIGVPELESQLLEAVRSELATTVTAGASA